MPVGDRRSTLDWRGQRRWCRFRAPARASETGAGAGFALLRDAGRRPALHVGLARRSVVGAGFALPRDAGRRPALHVGLARRSVVGAGFALLRDAGRRPALHVGLARCSVVGAGFALPRDAGRRPALHVRLAGPASSVRRFRAPARCRSETGAPREIGEAQRRWCPASSVRAPARCRSETGAPRGSGMRGGPAHHPAQLRYPRTTGEPQGRMAPGFPLDLRMMIRYRNQLGPDTVQLAKLLRLPDASGAPATASDAGVVRRC